MQKIKQLNREYHDKEADFYDQMHLHISEQIHLFKEVFSTLFLNNKKILDIGTGTGFVPANLDSKSQFICFDISLNMLEKVLEKNRGKDVNCICGDAENLPISANSVDIVTFSAVLHHLPNPWICLDGVYRILKPGGYLVIFQEPNNARKKFVKFLIYLYRRFKKADRSALMTKLSKKILNGEKLTENQAFEKVKRLSKETNYQEGFDPYNLLDNKFTVLKITTYYAYATKFYRLMSFLFPKSSELFYIIAKK